MCWSDILTYAVPMFLICCPCCMSPPVRKYPTHYPSADAFVRAICAPVLTAEAQFCDPAGFPIIDRSTDRSIHAGPANHSSLYVCMYVTERSHLLPQQQKTTTRTTAPVPVHSVLRIVHMAAGTSMNNNEHHYTEVGRHLFYWL